MARRKKVNLFPGYVRTDDINQEALAQLTREAKGNRSLREFAALCGTTGATLSRIINQQIGAPMGDELLKSIVDNAAEGAGIKLDEMLLANGLRQVKLDDAIDKFDVKKDESVSEDIAREVLQNELLQRGFSLELKMNPIIYEQKENFKYCADFSFRTNALEEIGIQEWCFDVLSNFAVHSMHRMHSLFSACYLGNPRGQRKKLSIVVLNADTFERLKEQYSGVVIRDYISVIYIDPIKRIVVDEYNLETTEKNIKVF